MACHHPMLCGTERSCMSAYPEQCSVQQGIEADKAAFVRRSIRLYVDPEGLARDEENARFEAEYGLNANSHYR